jgi:hypothetical protein
VFCLNTFRLFSIFSIILKILRKNGEYAEINFYFQQCLTMLKGKYFEEIEWGIINWPTMNKLQINFFGVIFNFKRRSAYMKNTVNSEKLTYKISTTFGPKPKTFESLFYTLYTVDLNDQKTHLTLLSVANLQSKCGFFLIDGNRCFLLLDIFKIIH